MLVILSMKTLNAGGMQRKISEDLFAITRGSTCARVNATITHESFIRLAPCIPDLAVSEKRGRSQRLIVRRKRIIAMKRDRALLVALNERGCKGADSVALEHGRCQLGGDS